MLHALLHASRLPIYRSICPVSIQNANGCRSAFGEDQPILLCSLHVLKAWMLQVRYKLVDKSRYAAAFKTLEAIVYFNPTGTLGEKRSALSKKVHDFKE
jgi:hypothetical protein